MPAKKKNNADEMPDQATARADQSNGKDPAQEAGEQEEWVRVGQNGEPLADQAPSAEEREAREIAANRTHTESLGDAWAVVTGQAPGKELMAQVAGTVMHAGGSRPAWQWKRGGKDHVLLAWPQDQPLRASVVVAGEAGGKLAPVTAAPLLEGLPNDLEVEAVHPWASGVDADVAVNMGSKNPMWFHDPLYGRDKDDLTPGVTHTFLLAGLAYGLRKALLDALTVTQGPRYEAYAAAWLAANPGKGRLDVPPLKVDVTNKHIIMPGRNFGEYQMRAVVEQTEEGKLEKMPFTVLYLSFPFESRPPLRLPVYATQMVLRDYEPKAGDQVDAYVWLQGRVIDLDEAPRQ